MSKVARSKDMLISVSEVDIQEMTLLDIDMADYQRLIQRAAQRANETGAAQYIAQSMIRIDPDRRPIDPATLSVSTAEAA